MASNKHFYNVLNSFTLYGEDENLEFITDLNEITHVKNKD